MEVGSNWFFEGAWAGRFTRNGLASSRFRCGSGVIFNRKGFEVLPPTHTLEGIYMLISDEPRRVMVSNSFPLLVGASDMTFDSGELSLVVDRARSIVKGLAEYQRTLLTRPQVTLQRFVSSRIAFVGGSGAAPTETRDNIGDPPFSTYAEYLSYVTRTISDIWANAASRKRKGPFRAITASCSSGYDSPACATIAKSLGCHETLTLTTARGGRGDSGKPIADVLGMECREFPRLVTELELELGKDHYTEPTLLSEDARQAYAPFFSSLVTISDAVFAPFAPYLSKRVYLSGFHGDKVWATRGSTTPYLVRGDNSGAGMDEFRLKHGFVHVPVPFIGAEFVETHPRHCTERGDGEISDRRCLRPTHSTQNRRGSRSTKGDLWANKGTRECPFRNGKRVVATE